MDVIRTPGRNVSVGDSVKKLNPHLFPSQASTLRMQGVVVSGSSVASIRPKKRIKQDNNPVLNQLETQWLSQLIVRYPHAVFHAQSWRVKIANGAWFKVDFCATIDGKWTAWEVKGPKQGKNVARGMLALKCACSKFPEVQWILAWKENGEWLTQKLKP